MKFLGFISSFLLVVVFFGAGVSTAVAQEATQKKMVASPPATATGKIGDANVTIHYAQPSVKGRKIWGELVPFGQVWRTGANEATTFMTDKALTFNGQTLPAGTYALFTIPGEKEWTIIFNKTAKQWGAFSYKSADDAIRFITTPAKSAAFNEQMKIAVADNKIHIMWENVEVKF